MNLSTMLRIAKMYRNLGDFVGEQLDDIADSGDFNDQNPNALRTIRDEMLKPAERLLRGRTDEDTDLADEIEELIGEIDDHLGTCGECGHSS